jgi:hypothetical protein
LPLAFRDGLQTRNLQKGGSQRPMLSHQDERDV